VSATFVERLSEGLNPIVVKELRQGLRTRVFWLSFGAMLLACLVVALVAFAANQNDEFAFDGNKYFLAFFVCLGLVHFFIIPYTAYRSLSREREDETWVLLTLTGLGPRSILRGKLGSFLVQAALYASAATPFMLFSYFLNGIDLPTILVTVALGWAYTLFLTAVAVSAATLAETKLLRAVMHLAVLGMLMGGAALGLGFAAALTEEGARLLDDREVKLAMLAAGWATVSFGALLFEGAAARLSLVTESYAFGPRLVFVLQSLASAVIGYFVWDSDGRKADVSMVLGIIYCVVVVMGGAFLVSDYDGQSRRQRALTRGFSLFRPGALRGFRLVMAVLALGVGFWMTLYYASVLGTNTADKDEPLFTFLAGACYVALYLSASLLAGRLPFLRELGPATASRLMFVALVFAGSTLPPLVAVLWGARARAARPNLFNPVVGMVNFAESATLRDGGMPSPTKYLAVLAGVTALFVLAADLTLGSRDDRVP
jgi:hypothetical protein